MFYVTMLTLNDRTFNLDWTKYNFNLLMLKLTINHVDIQ